MSLHAVIEYSLDLCCFIAALHAAEDLADCVP